MFMMISYLPSWIVLTYQVFLIITFPSLHIGRLFCSGTEVHSKAHYYRPKPNQLKFNQVRSIVVVILDRYAIIIVVL